MASAKCESVTGSGVEPGWGIRGEAEHLSFILIQIKEAPKAKDLSDNSLCVRVRLLLTAMTSPNF